MTGHRDKLENLNRNYNSGRNNLTVLYGRHGTGKTTLINEFIKDKQFFYHEALPGADFLQLKLMCGNAENAETGYEELFEALYAEGIRLFIIEEFNRLVKNGNGFMEGIIALLNNHEKVMIILGCSSVAWIENSMVKAIGSACLRINTFIKLKEFNYSDIVSLFPDFGAKNLLGIYAVTGGIPEYCVQFDSSMDIRGNICRLFLDRNGIFYNEAFNYINDEFREASIYNTILCCLASGRNKLNEIHEFTGYGRDKISVYLKNLMTREIVEKVFSYDSSGSENVKKGLYRIKDGFMGFWYRFIYPNRGMAGTLSPEEFYDRYIEEEFDSFLSDAYIKTAWEMLDIMNDMQRLPFKAERKGSWYGKAGNINIIYEDEKEKAIIGQVYCGQKKVSLNDLNELLKTVKAAKIDAGHFYLFSLNGFDEDVAGADITAIRIDEL